MSIRDEMVAKLKAFTAESILTIDEGRIREAINIAFKRAFDDCADRPTLDKERKVKIEVCFTPVGEDRLDSINVAFKIGESGPPRSSRPYNMRAQSDGLVYSELSPEDPDQNTFNFAEAKRKAATNGS